LGQADDDGSACNKDRLHDASIGYVMQDDEGLQSDRGRQLQQGIKAFLFIGNK
jgi:hypothetical protein